MSGSIGNRRRVAAAVVVGVVATAASSAWAASGVLTDKSETTKVGLDQSQSIAISCGKARRAISAGFEGDVSIDNADRSVYVANAQKLHSRHADLTFRNSTSPTGKVTGHVYCGTTKLQEAVASKTRPMDGGALLDVTAHCRRGTPYSGGFSAPFGPTGEGAIAVASYRSSGKAWTVQFLSVSQSAGVELRAYAYCGPGKPLSQRSATETLNQRPDNVVKPRSIDARCKPGERLISGGFRPRVVVNDRGPVTAASFRRNDSAWRIRAADLGIQPEPSRVTSLAYCRK